MTIFILPLPPLLPPHRPPSAFAEAYCIGCGACLYACPAEPRAFTLTPQAVQTLTPGIRPTDASEGLPDLPGEDGFPF